MWNKFRDKEALDIELSLEDDAPLHLLHCVQLQWNEASSASALKNGANHGRVCAF